MADETKTSNLIYSKLVEDENDILGIIAYALYKRQKFEFIANFEAKHQRSADQEDFERFNEFSMSELQLKSYANEAQTLAKDFLDSTLAVEAADLEKHYKDEADRQIKLAKPNFWFGVWQGVVASFIFVIVVGTLVFFTWSLKQGPRQVIENIFDVKIIDAAASESGKK
jgi:hypothetical protein